MVMLRQDFVELSCLGGDNIYDTVGKAFDWFYTGDGKNVTKATLRRLNGVKVTFERESDSRIGNEIHPDPEPCKVKEQTREEMGENE